MKKIVSILLAVLMVMCLLTACGGDKNNTADNNAANGAADAGSNNADSGDSSSDDTSASDLDYIKSNGTMKIGYTVYEPMNYTDDSGTFTGFDTELATAVCEKLGVKPEFVLITWNAKVMELESKAIDAIWNGMTITDELKENISISIPYVKNMQVLVVKKDSGITSTADLIGKTVVAEAGSAGETVINEDANLSQATYNSMSQQTDTLLEIKSGTADAAVLDWTLAQNMIGEGTDFADLIMVDGVELSVEEYGIGFRKGSDVTDAVNNALKELYKDGTLKTLADKYGLSLAPDVEG